MIIITNYSAIRTLPVWLLFAWRDLTNLINSSLRMKSDQVRILRLEIAIILILPSSYLLKDSKFAIVLISS